MPRPSAARPTARPGSRSRLHRLGDRLASTVAFLVGPGGDGYVGQVLSPNGGTVFIG